MERKLFLAAVVLPWVTLPWTAQIFSGAWDRLPTRVAVHFDANWQPNGWTSREGARTLALGMTLFLLLVFTISAFVVSQVRTASASKWVLIVVFYFAIGVVFSVNRWIVNRSLAQPASPVSEVLAGREGGG
jgi:hypothetical protein